MAVLVTGGAGYIGTHAAVVLHGSGRSVVLLDDLSNASIDAVESVRSLTSAHLAFVEGDAADVDLVVRAIEDHDVDEVVHFAAAKSVPESVERPLHYVRNNLGSLIGVLDAMGRTGLRRLVFSSSCAVYGEPETLPAGVGHPTRPTSPYGWTKLHGEQLVRGAAGAGAIDAMLLRYFNPVGAHPSGRIGEDPIGPATNLVPAVLSVAAGRAPFVDVYGTDYPTVDGSAVRDYLHVMDLVEAHLAALEALTEIPGCTTVDLGTGRGHSVLEVLAAAEAVVGSPIPSRIVGRRPGDVAAIWADPSTAHEVLGWWANRGLDEMLADHWHWTSASGPD